MKFNKKRYLENVKGLTKEEMLRALCREAEIRHDAEDKNIIAYKLADKFLIDGYWNTGWYCLVCGSRIRGLKRELEHKKNCDVERLLK